MSRRVRGPVQPSRERRTCHSQEWGSRVATMPLCLAGGACAVGTTRLLFVPRTVPATMHSPSQSEQLLLVFSHKRRGDTGPSSASSKAAGSAGAEKEERSPAQTLERQSAFPAVGAEKPHTCALLRRIFNGPWKTGATFSLWLPSRTGHVPCFGPSRNPSAVVWLFDRQKSTTLWHVEGHWTRPRFWGDTRGLRFAPLEQLHCLRRALQPGLSMSLWRICSKVATTTRCAKGRYELQCRA